MNPITGILFVALGVDRERKAIQHRGDIYGLAEVESIGSITWRKSAKDDGDVKKQKGGLHGPIRGKRSGKR